MPEQPLLPLHKLLFHTVEVQVFFYESVPDLGGRIVLDAIDEPITQHEHKPNPQNIMSMVTIPIEIVSAIPFTAQGHGPAPPDSVIRFMNGLASTNYHWEFGNMGMTKVQLSPNMR
jgi:hypothetical protein